MLSFKQYGYFVAEQLSEQLRVIPSGITEIYMLTSSHLNNLLFLQFAHCKTIGFAKFPGSLMHLVVPCLLLQLLFLPFPVVTPTPDFQVEVHLLLNQVDTWFHLSLCEASQPCDHSPNSCSCQPVVM